MRHRISGLAPLSLIGLFLFLNASSCSSETEDSFRIVVSPEGGKGGVGGGGSGGIVGGHDGGESQAGNAGKSQGGASPEGGHAGNGIASGMGGGGTSGGGAGGNTQGGTSGGGAAGAAGEEGIPASLSFTSPQEGQTFQQTGSPGEVLIPFKVQASSPIVRVEYHIENGDLLATQTNAPTFDYSHSYKVAGERWVEAQGFGKDDALLVSSTVHFKVKAPSLGPCLDELTALGVPFTPTKAKGVADAVKLQGPVNGVLFANGLKETSTADPIACEFVKTLWSFAEVLKSHGFVRVGTLGSYCFRCCCAWSESNYCRGPDDPDPDCGSKGYSNHSWGRAVDVRYLFKSDGTSYDINNTKHFVAYGGTDTCGAGIAKQSGISLELYQVACEAHSKKVFSTILTPNYNSDHRNHFHMDTGKSGPATGSVVKILPDVLHSIDVGEYEDHCGP